MAAINTKTDELKKLTAYQKYPETAEQFHNVLCPKVMEPQSLDFEFLLVFLAKEK